MMGTYTLTAQLRLTFLGVCFISVMSQTEFPVSPVSSSDDHACDTTYEGEWECCSGFYLSETVCVECPTGYYGYKCANTCSPNCDTMDCDHTSGQCECTDPGYYGTRCDNICQCENGATCDRLSGTCTCQPTYWGDFCQCKDYEEISDDTCQCPVGHYGPTCTLTCQCYNGARCSRDTGECTCVPGWTGHECTDCDKGLVYPGTSLPFCDGRCFHCTNGDNCHPDNTEQVCQCADGWMNSRCDTCDRNHYGYQCEHICNCQNNAECDLGDGTCKCLQNYWGEFCEKDCPCYNDAKCDKQSGQCRCSIGWTGTHCEDCDESIILEGGINYCSSTCLHCTNGYSCNYAIQGDCQCTDGWSGDRCNAMCTDNSYGPNCQSKCQCKNAASCDHGTGECKCLDGWDGDRCDTPCDGLHYGQLCRLECQCKNGALCSPVNGYCSCSDGWTGDSCDTPCGLNCSDQCQCQNNLVCVDGTCSAGSVNTTSSNQDTSKLSIAVGVTVAFLLLIIAVTIATVFIVRRMNCMKNRNGNYEGIIKATRRTDTMATTEQSEFSIDMGGPSCGPQNGDVVYAIPGPSTVNARLAEPVYAELENEEATALHEAPSIPEYAEVQKKPQRETRENDRQENEYDISWETGGERYDILGAGVAATHEGDASPYNVIDRTGKTYRPSMKQDSNYSKLT